MLLFSKRKKPHDEGCYIEFRLESNKSTRFMDIFRETAAFFSWLFLPWPLLHRFPDLAQEAFLAFRPIWTLLLQQYLQLKGLLLPGTERQRGRWGKTPKNTRKYRWILETRYTILELREMERRKTGYETNLGAYDSSKKKWGKHMWEFGPAIIGSRKMTTTMENDEFWR